MNSLSTSAISETLCGVCVNLSTLSLIFILLFSHPVRIYILILADILISAASSLKIERTKERVLDVRALKLKI